LAVPHRNDSSYDGSGMYRFESYYCHQKKRRDIRRIPKHVDKLLLFIYKLIP